MVEELVEEGSALLSERLDTKYPLCNMFKLFMCAVCLVEMKPGEGAFIIGDFIMVGHGKDGEVDRPRKDLSYSKYLFIWNGRYQMLDKDSGRILFEVGVYDVININRAQQLISFRMKSLE